VRLQVFSDIHLEFGDLTLPAVDADVIVAAGDIGVGCEAAPWLQRLRRPVIYIAGNHEFYGAEMGRLRHELAAACAGSNVHFLDNSIVRVAGVRFLGATLWSDFDNDPLAMHEAQAGMNDYALIEASPGRTLTPADGVALQRAACAWLERNLVPYHPEPTVVVTHHAPSHRSWPWVDEPLRRAAYCNQLDPFVERCGATLWIHGHVHARADYRIGDCRVVCNPRGYAGVALVPRFDPGLIIEI
jgi:predicted phosphodiesterase